MTTEPPIPPQPARGDADGQPFVSWHRVEEFIGSGRSVRIPLHAPGTRRVEYVVQGGSAELQLELAGKHRAPRSPLPVIRIEEIAHDGLRMARLRLTRESLLRDFHDLLNAVTDRVVVHGRTANQAFTETVRAWSALLERPRTPSTERRIGLLGELMVLTSVAAGHSWGYAVEAWKGPEGEEHDFGLAACDAEVKTTASERRHHTVQGLRQLSASPGRPLWLVSVQLTRGGANGRTLADCVHAVRERLTDEAPDRAEGFDRRLAALGWSAGQPDDERWSLRTEPLVFPVDEEFPRLHEGMFSALPEAARTHVEDVTYRLDLSGLAPGTEPPAALTALRLP
ncbi:PD-(D/E)XK motif protein [Streptomyces lycii]|uniref:PD-(D/E)XK motif protein n=1 Tax=Streptomyces lycii TaxID=2654337 RepID=A0ABQ7FBE6_9ACTN|nr:PD-(D/E)XK motif protein [Streptomyces lycii]KAF4405857.1 PD-(D/E)XK motif protein [Streptomyces lycii]